MTDTDMQLEEALKHLVHWPDQRKYAERIRDLFKQQEERGWNLAHEPAKCGHARANYKDSTFGTPDYAGDEKCEVCQAIDKAWADSADQVWEQVEAQQRIPIAELRRIVTDLAGDGDYVHVVELELELKAHGYEVSDD